MLAQSGGLPDAVIACVGGGSNAIGMFHPFIGDKSVEIIGIEAGGTGKELGHNAATLAYGRPGVLQGAYSLLLQDDEGQIQETDSVSAGLDYPGVGPEHSLLLWAGRVRYEAATDDESLDALTECCRTEGILPAIESAHAFAGAKRWAQANPGKKVLIGLSGRGDKDMPTLQRTVLAGAEMTPSEKNQRRHSPGARRHRDRRLRHRGLSAAREIPRAPHAGRQRGGRRRDRRAVHRSDGRRHDHPALEPRGAAPGLSACAGCSTSSRRCSARATAESAARAHELPEPAAGVRLREARQRVGAGRRVRLHHSRPAVRRKRRSARRRSRRMASRSSRW